MSQYTLYGLRYILAPRAGLEPARSSRNTRVTTWHGSQISSPRIDCYTWYMPTHAPLIRLMLTEGYSFNKIVQALGCSKGTIGYHAKRMGIVKQPTNHGPATPLKHCAWCGCFLARKKKSRYCEEACKISACDDRRIWDKTSHRVIYARQKTKLKAIAYKGGLCQIPQCGYNKTPRSMHFHHVDPSLKAFAISNKGLTVAWSRVQKELDKCILVCSNCHGEIHDGLHSADLLQRLL